MINFYISQMGALVLNDKLNLSNLLRSQIASAPLKADNWRLRCEQEELLKLRSELTEMIERDSEVKSSSVRLVLEEIEEICQDYT